mmetsp:Transcript_184/g.481  ORF Transcript_184/g.481 Transcript_184/m.481 type:complete len:267 (-) Transcript_184:52-852(-)
MREVCYNWSDKLRAESINHLLGHDSGSHARPSKRGDTVTTNVLACTLASQGLCQTKNAELSSRVVSLAEVAIEASSTCNVDDAAVRLLTHVLPGCLAHTVGTLQVNSVNEVPVFLGHLVKSHIAKDSSIVDDNIHAAEGINGSFNDLFAELDRVIVGHSITTRRLDLVNDLVSSIVRSSLAVCAASKIINNDLGATGPKKKCVRATEAVASTSYNSDFTIKAERHFDFLLVFFLSTPKEIAVSLRRRERDLFGSEDVLSGFDLINC